MIIRILLKSVSGMKFNEEEELRKILDVQKRIKLEIQKLNDKCEQMDSETQPISKTSSVNTTLNFESDDENSLHE